jgi:hypothetical protein
MKKAIIAIIAVVVISTMSLFLYRGESQSTPEGIPAPTAEVSNLAFKGEVIGVNAEQAKFDGPYLFAIREASGNEIVVSVSPRGGRLCAAGANIAEPSGIQKGMVVEVSGALTFEGNIVPCESASHYLRVVNKK